MDQTKSSMVFLSKKSLIFIFLLSLFLLSCEKEGGNLDSDNTNTPSSLKDLITKMTIPSLNTEYHFKYDNNQNVI